MAPTRSTARAHSLLSGMEKKGASSSGARIIVPGGKMMPMASFGGGGGGFTGADRGSSSRGYVVFPQLDTRKEVNAMNRTEIMRKARWGYNNDPFQKRCVDGIARHIGFMMFQPHTPDKEWNALAKRVMMDIAMSRERFDRTAKHNFFSYQLQLGRLQLKDGGSLTAPVLGDDGVTKVLCYEAHQIGDRITPRGDSDQGWFDGVLTDKQNKALAYRVLHPTDPQKSTVLKAGQSFYFARYERPGQNRGMSALHPIVNSALDVREIQNDMTLAIKTRNLIGFYLGGRDGDEPKLKGSQAVQAAMKQYRRENASDGDDIAGEGDEDLAYEDVFGGGNIPAFGELEPKVLESAQPHENEMAFLNWKIRGMANSLEFPPELLWDIGNLNGNTQRWLAADVQEVVEMRRMEMLIPFCQWWWFHTMGSLIALGPDNGGIRAPKIPKDQEGIIGWWTVDWIPPKKKTIDRGRDGKINLDERRALLRSLDNHFSEQQLDWTTEIDQWLEEVVAIKDLAKEKNFSDDEITLLVTNLLAPPAGTAIPEGANSQSEPPPKKDAA